MLPHAPHAPHAPQAPHAGEGSVNSVSDAETAARVVALIDATNLADDCTDDDVVELCRSATGAWGSVAGVCVFARFVALARAELGADSEVRLVTVTNFPSGDDTLDDVVAATRRALDDGADEIDVVLPYHSFLAGDTQRPAALLDAARDAVDEARTLKVIIESGEMADRAQIDAAARFSVDHGADFVKTSTGKTALSATPEAVETILGVLSTAERPVGVKAAGGVRSLEDAAAYLAMADRIMGDGWASAETFRFGSSSLLASAVEALDQPRQDDDAEA